MSTLQRYKYCSNAMQYHPRPHCSTSSAVRLRPSCPRPTAPRPQRSRAPRLQSCTLPHLRSCKMKEKNSRQNSKPSATMNPALRPSMTIRATQIHHNPRRSTPHRSPSCQDLTQTQTLSPGMAPMTPKTRKTGRSGTSGGSPQFAPS